MSDIAKKLDIATMKGINKFIHHLHGKILDVTPLDTGELRKSIEVTKEATESDLTAEITSSGSVAPYNIYVHEIPFTHYTTRGTGYKFIERPAEEEKNKLKDFIKAEVKK